MPEPIIDLGNPELAKPASHPLNRLMIELSKPEGATLIDPKRSEQVMLWTRSSSPEQAIYRDPEAMKADLRHLGFFDDAGQLKGDRVAAARAYLHRHWQSAPNYPAFWRHLAALAGLVSPENPKAEYLEYSEHIAQLIDAGVANTGLATAILAAEQENMDVPTQPLWQADRIRLTFELFPDGKHPELTAAMDARDINWFPPDGALQGLRRLLKDQSYGLGETEFEAWVADQGSAGLQRQIKGFFGSRNKAQTLRDLGILDADGTWSEVGFQRQQAAVREAQKLGIPPALEYLRWTLFRRHKTDALIPFDWALMDDKLPSVAVHRARRVASIALSGGLLGERVEVGAILTADQYETLRKIGAWIVEPLDFQRHEALWWLGLLARNDDINWHNVEQICSFVSDKLDQTPDRALVQDWMAGVVTFEGAGRHQKAPAKPFSGTKKVGRNDPCPCGSGRKHKKCCGL